MNNNSVYSNAGVNRDLQRHCIISQVTGLAVSFAGSAGVALSAGTQSALSGTVVLSASNGVAFGMTDSTVTASAAIRLSASSNTTLTQTGTIDINSFVVRGVGGVSVGYSAGEMVISGATGGGGGGGGVALSAGTNSTATGTVVFSNSNGVSFGMNTNAIVTASTGLPLNVDGDAATVTQLIFTASNGITFGLDGASITASHNGLTSQSNQAVSAGNGSVAFQTVSFSNANGISFSTAAGPAIVASHNGLTSQSNQTGNVSATGNTIATNSTSATYNATGLLFAGSGVASVGVSNGSVVISVPSGGGGGDGFNRIAAGTRSATSLGTVLFSNANGVSFGLDATNGSVVTASHDGLTSQSNQQVTAANGGFAFQTLSFQDSNGISFSTAAGSAIFIDHRLQHTSNTSAITSNALHSSASRVFNVVAATNNTGGGAASLSSNVSFSAANGATFYTSAGNAVVLSYSVPTVTNSSMTVSDAATSGTLARLAFTNLNGVTLSLSTGAGGSHTIVGSHNALTSQSNQAFSAGAASSTFQTLSFQDSNGVSFSNNAGAIRVTHDLQATSATSAITSNALHSTAAAWTVSATNDVGTVRRVHFGTGNGVTFGLSTGANSLHTITASHNGITSQTAQTLGLYAVSNTTGQSSSSTFDARTLSFHGAGIASVGYSGGSVVISVPSGGGAGDGYNFLAVTNSTANSTARVLLQDSNGISFGMSGSNSATVSITASISQATLSNSNNVSFGAAAGVITASATWPSLGISAGSQSVSTGTMVFSDSNGLSFGMSGSSRITMSNDMRFTDEYWQNGPFALVTNVTNWTALTNRPLFFPLSVERPITWNRGNILVSRATSGSDAFTVTWGIYGLANKTQLSNLTSSSGSYSNTATASNSGLRLIHLPALTGASTMTPGVYVVGMLMSNVSTASANYSLRGFSSWGGLGQFAPGADQYTTATSALSSVGPSFLGRYSTTTSALPETVARSHIQHWNSAAPLYLMLSST